MLVMKVVNQKMEECLQLQIQRFEPLLSPTEFTSNIESKNVPAVFNGCIKNWKACVKWNPANDGLDYLEERVGSSTVEAMLSRTAPVFYGDIRSHERVPLPFDTFIGFCKQRMQNTANNRSLESESHQVRDVEQESLLSVDAPQQVYLAQVPIMNAENQERVQLEALREDIQTPTFLATKELASINLWMNNAPSRSSTHYDPHHNVLCIVAGCKQVLLWPPSASAFLYPMPVYGEASNHSSVTLENPDFSLYPRAKCSMNYSQKVVLHAGDALFIPEGWFHQVDSDGLTIAVNFWWQSNIMSNMLEHMDAYYFRRLLRRLTDKEMEQLLPKTFPGTDEVKRSTGELLGLDDHGCCHINQASKRRDLLGKDLQQRVKLNELEPSSLQALHELVSLVHDRVNITNQSHSLQSTPVNDCKVSIKDECDKTSTTNLFFLEDDLVAKIIWTLDPSTLQDILLAMAHNFPRTLEALILHLLSPVGAEVLTRKFDEIDQQMVEEDRNKFYQVFYGAFDDQFAAMNAILNGKESFALQAFKNCLDKYAGVSNDSPKPSIR